MGQALLVPMGVVLTASVIAAVTDLLKFKVHNLLTMPLLICGLIYHGMVSGSAGLVESLLGMIFGFGILVIFYVMGGMGAGDVKLMAAVGAWLGMRATFLVFIATGLAAGLYAIGVIIWYHRVSETWVNLQILWHRISAVGRHLAADDRVEVQVQQADRRSRIIPFAAMMAIGILATVALAWYGGRP